MAAGRYKITLSVENSGHVNHFNFAVKGAIYYVTKQW